MNLPTSEPSQTNLARDRIAQVYLGQAGGPEFQERTKNRIHWMASHAIGEHILDIGCSEGILALLLAREGFQVIGVDVNDEALDYARQLLERENEFVQSRVKLIHSDLVAADIDLDFFDTVYLGEVIEHLAKPDIMLDKAFASLKPGGRIIITTPFGYHPDPDHRQTFTLSRFVKLLTPHCNPEQLFIEDNYIRFVGLKEKSALEKWEQYNEAVLLNISEKAILAQQHLLRGQLSEKSEKLNNANLKYRESSQKVIDLNNKLKDANQKFSDAEKQKREISSKLDEEKKARSMQVQELEQKLKDANQKFSDAEKQKREISSKLDEEKKARSMQVQELDKKFLTASQALQASGGKLLDNIQLLKDIQLEKQQADVARQRSENEKNKIKQELEGTAKSLHALKDEHQQLKTLAEEKEMARQRAAANYIVTRKRLNEQRESVTYKMYQITAQAFAKPGKNTFLLPYRLVTLFLKGMAKTFRGVKNCPVVSLPLALPSQDKTSLNFITSKPGNIVADKSLVWFKFPPGESGYLTSKENCNFTILPQTDHFKLEPETEYTLHIPLRIFAGSVVLYCIEFDKTERVAQHVTRKAGPGGFQVFFTTHKQHQSMCLALRLSEYGSIEFNPRGISVQRGRLELKGGGHNFIPLLSESNTTTPDSHPQKMRAIAILDEISELCWSKEFEIHRISRDNFVKQIAESKPSFAFLESCWNGNDGHWQYAFTSPELKHANAQDLLKVIALLKDRKIPTLFWNKEDPMHFERFLPIAQQADIIATTDSRMVDKYREHVPDAKTGIIPFAAQQVVCNPSERFRTEPESVCFAGSYYCHEHDHRKQQMDSLLPCLNDFDGVIYDRMSHLNNDRYTYPDIYSRLIRPGVPFHEMLKIYKNFKVFLNVNTITDSPTMMSRRVYELLACGTPVVSTPSAAIDAQFPGIVQTASDAREAKEIVSHLLEDEWHWSRISHLGYREVLQKHTYAIRKNQLLNLMGHPNTVRPPLVSMVVPTKRSHLMERIVNNLTKQNHPRLEAIIITHDYSSQDVEKLRNALNSQKQNNLERIVIFEMNGSETLGQRMNAAVKISHGEYIAKMDDDDLYFENYIADMLLPFTFGAFDVVGKKEVFVYLEPDDAIYHRFPGSRHMTTDFVAGPTMVIKRSVFEKVSFSSLNRSEDSNFLEQVLQTGGKIYSADPFNFIQFRGTDKKDHTWNVDGEFFTAKGTHICDGRISPKICF